MLQEGLRRFASGPGGKGFNQAVSAARQGVSNYERHALVPHEAYQALYAAGEAQKIFLGYKVHILSKGQVISDV